jgi:glycosyltransferase involved in cell wall biosynthesis
MEQDDVRLIIAGTGPLKEPLNELAGQLGIQHKIRLLGARTDIPEVLNALDLFVLPSLSEGMPNAVLEAMACGLPVVATEVGGVSEVVEHGVTGLLVPSEDEEALASRLEELVCSETKRQMLGKNARERALACFSLDKMVRAYEQLYVSLVKGRTV